ncbi:hypothetical protein P154DRAFT_577325 [Amniculicola lignicola CBS 123094]|uniref:Apple domain-containing protein n=1 Tax=Amniculicola lignicola CBS 123094 TaxID=1392246 RepID=A0A6A5WNI8_9PLEO|nr:hypothetical protein P154DRAFT_577325 [Amniculicola lignicola CBS 123094]
MDDDRIDLVRPPSSAYSVAEPSSSSLASPQLQDRKVHPQIWPPEPKLSPIPEHGHAGLEVQEPHSNLEVYAVHQPTQQWAYYGNGEKSGGYPEVVDEKRILGLRRSTFWFLVVLAGVVVGAAIGGGVGGAMIGRERDREKERNQLAAIQASLSTSATSIPTPSSSATSIATSIVVSATTTTTGGFIATFTPPSPMDVGRIPIACPPALSPSGAKNVSILTALPTLPMTSASFMCLPSTDLVAGDITGIQAFSLQQCIDACATMNKMQGMRRCLAVTIGEDVAELYRGHWGANCWLKGVGTNSFSGPDKAGFVSARFCVEGGCVGGDVWETVED